MGCEESSQAGLLQAGKEVAPTDGSAADQLSDVPGMGLAARLA